MLILVMGPMLTNALQVAPIGTNAHISLELNSNRDYKGKTEDVLSTSVLTTWGGEAPISSEAPCLHECRRVMDSIGFRSSMHNSDVRVGCVWRVFSLRSDNIQLVRPVLRNKKTWSMQ